MIKNARFLTLPLACIHFSLSGVAKPESDEFELHEWGVFTAPRGAEWLQQDMIHEWMGFPEFFHGVLPERKLNYHSRNRPQQRAMRTLPAKPSFRGTSPTRQGKA